jgi:hypothetical protein
MGAKKMELITSEEARAPVVQEGGAGILDMLERVIARPDVPIEKVQQLFELQLRAQAEQNKRAFMEAFTACQSEMAPIARDAPNSQTKSKYATHAALDKVLRPIYTQHGFGVSFNTADSPLEQHVRVLLYLTHEAGHEKVYQADIPCDGKGPKGNDVMSKTHAAGSAMTYGKRYLLALAFNIAVVDSDDDGNAASTPQNGNDTISAAQCDELIKLADEVGADKARFCKFVGIESFAEIRVKDFEKAKGMLKRKAAP